MMQLIHMNSFKKLGAGSKPPSVGGLNLMKNLTPLVGQKRPIKVEPLNLVGNLKKFEKKEPTQSSSSAQSEEPETKKEPTAEESLKETSSVGQSGVVKRVYETDSHYHFSSTKAPTAVGGDSFENSGEFKLKRKDTYLEKR
jgi:hypothetical protein